jgi:hypothetical protein
MPEDISVDSLMSAKQNVSVVLPPLITSDVPNVNSQPTERSIKEMCKLGRAMAEAVSRWLPTAAARVKSRVWSSGICGG